jgi:hypothetical protein
LTHSLSANILIGNEIRTCQENDLIYGRRICGIGSWSSCNLFQALGCPAPSKGSNHLRQLGVSGSCEIFPLRLKKRQIQVVIHVWAPWRVVLKVMVCCEGLRETSTWLETQHQDGYVLKRLPCKPCNHFCHHRLLFLSLSCALCFDTSSFGL